jgi:hypothetical protein
LDRNAVIRGELRSESPGTIIRHVDGDDAIREIIDRETRAWNTKDVPLLLSVFHPDMVWAWPNSYTSVDPVEWHLGLGKFDDEISMRTVSR